jgi:hypothetical protein
MEFARGTVELQLSMVSDWLSVAESMDISRLLEIEYLALHFYEVCVVPKRWIHSCSREVLGSDRLQLESEDSLLNVILERGRDRVAFLGKRSDWPRSPMQKPIGPILGTKRRLPGFAVSARPF